MVRRFIIALSSWLLTAGAFAQDIHSLRVVDGDTLKIGSTTYRLWGIDAPETHQFCGTWRAGIDATAKLREAIAGKSVACERKDTDRYGRTVAICRANGEDLGALMVSSGMAWAFVQYTLDYVEHEAKAKKAGLGVHGHPNCEVPWKWRAEQKR